MADDDKLKQEVQQKFMEMQMTHQQLQQLQQQVQAIEQQVGEIENVQHNLDELSNTKEGTETLVPISSGIFVTTKMHETQKVKVNVGGGTVVEKSIPDTKKMLQTQMAEMRRVQTDILKNVEELQKKAAAVEAELAELSQ